MVDNHSRSVHLCNRDCIAWNSRVFKPLRPVSGGQARQHIAACTVCCRQFMIRTHCRLVEFLMSCIALKAGDHSPNFELWCLVLSVELVWYVNGKQLQPVLWANDSNIFILLHKPQYQLSEFSFPCMHMAIMVTFREKYPRLAVWFEKGHLANGWSYDGSLLK